MPSPHGAADNFTSTASEGNVLVITCSVFLFLMTVFMLVRVYAAAFVRKTAHWSDVTCFIGFLLTIAYYASCVLGTQHGYVGRHSWDVSVLQLMESNFFVTSYLENILCPAGLGFIKLSFFLLYLHLFAPSSSLKTAIWIGGSVSTVFYTLIVILTFIFMTPRPHETFAAHTATSLATKQVQMSVPLAAIGVFLDFYILILPIVGVSRLQLPSKRKFGVAIVFMTGGLACVASILTLYYRVRIQSTDDILLLLVPTLITSLVEMEIGVICSCVPALSQTLRHHLPAYNVLKTRIYASFNLSRQSRSEGTNRSTMDSMHIPDQSKTSFVMSNYAVLGKGGNASSETELNKANPMETVISGGGGSQRGEGIWMKHQLEQERSRTREMV